MGEEDGGKCISTSEARFKGVNLAPKGEGGSVADGYSSSSVEDWFCGFYEVVHLPGCKPAVWFFIFFI
jgi:hypothetical protein